MRAVLCLLLVCAAAATKNVREEMECSAAEGAPTPVQKATETIQKEAAAMSRFMEELMENEKRMNELTKELHDEFIKVLKNTPAVKPFIEKVREAVNHNEELVPKGTERVVRHLANAMLRAGSWLPADWSFLKDVNFTDIPETCGGHPQGRLLLTTYIKYVLFTQRISPLSGWNDEAFGRVATGFTQMIVQQVNCSKENLEESLNKLTDRMEDVGFLALYGTWWRSLFFRVSYAIQRPFVDRIDLGGFLDRYGTKMFWSFVFFIVIGTAVEGRQPRVGACSCQHIIWVVLSTVICALEMMVLAALLLNAIYFYAE